MGLIRKQAAYSSLFIILGFIIGAINILIIFPRLMSKEQLGLTRLMLEASMMIASLCCIGIPNVANKFFPYYKQHLPKPKNDLGGLSFAVCMVGFAAFLIIAFTFKGFVVSKFSNRSPLFSTYYYLLIPFTLSYLLFIWLEVFAIGYHKTILSNSLKETFNRVYTTLLLGLLALGILKFNSFMICFSFIFMIPAGIIWYTLRSKEGFVLTFTVSRLTKRFKKVFPKFFAYAIFGSALSMLMKTMDTFFLAGFSTNGLGDVAIFTIATYITMIMDIPFRSVSSSSTAILSSSWRTKDLANISHIYRQSSLNLLLVGFFLFGCIWINLHQLTHIFPKEYKIAPSLILIMAITKLIDLGTGLNGHILGTSPFWKFEFYTNIILSILAVFVNGFLIKHFGLMGAAYGTLVTLCLYNFTRFVFLWIKFRLQPFTYKNLLLLAISVSCIFLFNYIPSFSNWIVDIAFRSMLFGFTYFGLILLFNISQDARTLINMALTKLK